MVRTAAALFALALGLGLAWAGNATQPGEVVVQEPTLVCLGFEWFIEGDDNANCAVEVAYRCADAAEWRQGMPLFRVERRPWQNRITERGQTRPYFKEMPEEVSFGNKLSGSIFYLEPGVEYQVRLRLKDPDGGEAERLVTACTRAVPVAWNKGRTIHVAPGEGGGKGTPDDPFRGCAAADAAAQPGDVVLMAAGEYGSFAVTRDGEPGRPVVWRGAGQGKTIVRGEKAASAEVVKDPVVDLRGRKHVILEALTVCDGAWGIRMEQGEDLTVRRCRIERCDIGIAAWAMQSLGKRFLICDNTLKGDKEWGMGLGPGAAKDVIGLEGVVPTGDGHVICHNRIEGFSDGISFGGIHQAPDGTRLSGPNNSVDVYGNEISTCLDDGIELDWGRSNIRCFGNRVTNALKGVSCQPTWGGPVYIVRNAIVNVQSFLKFHCEPVGMVILHNTAFAKDGWAGGEWHHAVMRNTVIASAASPVLGTRAHNADFDFNGYILAPKAQYHFHLGRAFKTLEEYQREMGLDRHSLILTPTDFVKAELTDASRKLAVGEMDLRLKPDSRAVDAGETLPNISDGFAGRAPDLGCYEAGQPLPYYGPRE